uniref:Serine rich and transmembrane domain containing 1 n=1 Tax=Callorhinchus milii TaxID=7868 RepID=A0A4W3JRN6_CALMI
LLGSETSSCNSGNETIDVSYPTPINTAVASSISHLSNVFIYVSIFLSLLAFLLLLLIIALHRLKNVIGSSSSCPECTSTTGSSFTNLEVCSLSSQRSAFSTLSS